MADSIRDLIIDKIRQCGFAVSEVVEDLIILDGYGSVITLDLYDGNVLGVGALTEKLSFISEEGSYSALLVKNGFLYTNLPKEAISSEQYQKLTTDLFNNLDLSISKDELVIAQHLNFRISSKGISIVSTSNNLSLVDIYEELGAENFERFLNHFLSAILNRHVLSPVYAHLPIINRSILELNTATEAGYPKEWFYKPAGLDLEILNKCTVECKECAVLEDVQRGTDRLTKEEINSLLNQAKALGIYAYSITGGEPFVRFNDICTLIAENSDLDCFKIQTNGTFFSSLDKSKRLITDLITSGFGVKNSQISSTLMYSVGIQNYSGGVPIKNLGYLLLILNKLEIWKIAPFFRLGIGLTVREGEDLLAKESEIRRFVAQNVSSQELFSIIHFSIYPVQYSNGQKEASWSGELVEFEELLNFHNQSWPGCFTSEETVWPKPIVKANGDLYTCGCFGYGFLAGNIKDKNLFDLIQAANKIEQYYTINKYGVAGAHERNLFPNSSKMKSQKVPINMRMCNLCGVLGGKISI